MSRPVAGKPMAQSVRRGLVWSFANTLVLRMAGVVLGVVLARLLVPSAFGVFAIGLTVQSILATLADLGLSADLVRSKESPKREATVATLSLASGAVLALGMTLTAGLVAGAMHNPHATDVIMVLSWTLVINGAGVVPYSRLQRNFQQERLFACSAADFCVYTGVTIALVQVGFGPMALAVGRLSGQFVDTALQFVLSGTRPQFSFDRAMARQSLGYGVPIAGANFLSWALLNIDNVVVARVAGATSLGLYVLAFNISSWPMTAIGTAVRSVSLAGFSQTSKEDQDRSFTTALALTWAVALPIGVLLAALSRPIVSLLYGDRWSASSAALAALGVFGGLRVAFDLIATYLMAKGAARPVLYVQALWFFALIPPMVLATRWFGIAGAGWAHLVVGAVIILPAYCVALARVGTPIRPILATFWLPIVAVLPTWWLAKTVADHVHEPALAILLGGTIGAVAYTAICYRRLRRLWPAVQGKAPATADVPDEITEVPEPALVGPAAG